MWHSQDRQQNRQDIRSESVLFAKPSRYRWCTNGAQGRRGGVEVKSAAGQLAPGSLGWYLKCFQGDSRLRVLDQALQEVQRDHGSGAHGECSRGNVFRCSDYQTWSNRVVELS